MQFASSNRYASNKNNVVISSGEFAATGLALLTCRLRGRAGHSGSGAAMLATAASNKRLALFTSSLKRRRQILSSFRRLSGGGE
ncbi:MAG: hypothetical protein WCI45_08885 [Desulfuromonadales bacterium]